MIYLTDKVTNPDIERALIGDKLSTFMDEQVDFSLVKVILVWHEHVDSSFLDNFPNLTSVVRYGVGYERIDLNACRARRISVANNPDYGVDEVSDTAIALIMALSRCTSRYDARLKSISHKDKLNQWQVLADNKAKRLSESTLGVIGAGRIGSAVIRKMSAIVKEIVVYDPYISSGFEKTLRFRRFDELDDLLACSDIVSIHTPLTSETKGIIDREFIGKMKNDSILINTARGELIKNTKLISEALLQQRLRAVGLDVLPLEPFDKIIDRELLEIWKSNDNHLIGRVVINPHTAFFSEAAFKEMRYNAARQALRLLNGERTNNMII